LSLPLVWWTTGLMSHREKDHIRALIGTAKQWFDRAMWSRRYRSPVFAAAITPCDKESVEVPNRTALLPSPLYSGERGRGEGFDSPLPCTQGRGAGGEGFGENEFQLDYRR
jgi:hypothetical protein